MARSVWVALVCCPTPVQAWYVTDAARPSTSANSSSCRSGTVVTSLVRARGHSAAASAYRSKAGRHSTGPLRVRTRRRPASASRSGCRVAYAVSTTRGARSLSSQAT